jgi:HlyD family secretion protein
MERRTGSNQICSKIHPVMLQRKKSKIMLKLTAATLLASSFVFAMVKLITPGSSIEQVDFRTAVVKRQTISNAISATGTLEPCEIIDVGAQVAGRVIAFGTDPDTKKHLDYGSRVTKGMVLASIDPTFYETEVAIAEAQAKRSTAQLAQAVAALKEAEASVHRSEAELLQQQSKLERSTRELQRSQGLAKSNSMSESEVDMIRSENETLLASVTVAKAAIEQSRSRLESQNAAIAAARADAENTQAMLKRSRTTLDYCSIVSPIDGVIIDRRVNQGQTVVASLSTPSLFLLASDLRQLEIWVSVNEADIGLIRPKMHVRFAVDAFPEKTFTGFVKQIRLNASMNQNVVTYTVVVSVENYSDLLLPYLTANVDFIVDERPNVLCVPTSALRFKPKDQVKIQDNQTTSATSQQSVFVIEQGKLSEVPVETGISDGNIVEVTSKILKEGQQIVTGYLVQSAASEATNPFVPRMKSAQKEPGK